MFVLKSIQTDYGRSHSLAEKLGTLIRTERKITNEILQLIREALDCGAYLDLGYSSMYDWLTKGFGYSNAAAYRRIEAAKLLRSLPPDTQNELSRKIESGAVNLTTLSKVQTTIKAQEKMSGKKVSAELKRNAVFKVSGILESNSSYRQDSSERNAHDRKSEDETQRILFELMPDAQSEVMRDHKKVISEDLTRHSITFTKEMEDDLRAVKDLVSHSCPSGTDQEVIAYALKFLLRKGNHRSAEIFKKENQT